MKVDAIVNTASPIPGYGSGIDTAVYRAAGEDELLEQRRRIGVIEEGEAVITDGYSLPAKYIIHAVGTPWKGGMFGEEEVIRKCYRSIFRVADANGIESLAIPLIASGSYGFPKGIAMRIALSEIESFMAGSEMNVYLVVFDGKSFELSSELYGDIDSYINDNYVEEKSSEEYEPVRNETFFGRLFGGSRFGMSVNATAPARTSEDRKESRKGSIPEFEEEPAEDTEAPAEDADDEYRNIAGSIPMYASMPMESARSLEDVVSNLDKTFMELVFTFADEKGMSDAEVQKKANIERKAFSKLRCGTTKNPSKATALALAVALELNLDETKDLLSRAGLALSPCSKQDVIVQYFIERKAYSVFEINIALFEHGEPPIGSQID